MPSWGFLWERPGENEKGGFPDSPRVALAAISKFRRRETGETRWSTRYDQSTVNEIRGPFYCFGSSDVAISKALSAKRIADANPGKLSRLVAVRLTDAKLSLFYRERFTCRALRTHLNIKSAAVKRQMYRENIQREFHPTQNRVSRF